MTIGDWVHIRNPNDLSKPIVAQIYRMWSDKSGQKWVNACWFYRPEQTVHRYDKFFYENEVVKTGQYRDHRIEEVEDRCFVMFITRYPKGRPRGLPFNKMVYVCEARYNEEKCKFNKVKTWSSCLPEEVRDQDYEMDLWPVPRTMRKIPSPIKHLLQADAKETDDLPKPTWRSPNAPPLIGAVHRRPREPNVSEVDFLELHSLNCFLLRGCQAHKSCSLQRGGGEQTKWLSMRVLLRIFQTPHSSIPFTFSSVLLPGSVIPFFMFDFTARSQPHSSRLDPSSPTPWVIPRFGTE